MKDRVVVITGASSGIGAALARQLAAAGARVVVAARRAAKLEELCAEIRAAGGVAEAQVTDMRDEAQVEALVEAAVARWGAIDALVNNAAYGALRKIEDGRSEEWRATVETNLLGTLAACRAAVRHMLPRGQGTILNVTSATAHEAWPYFAVYAGTKAAVFAISKSLRAEVAERGIRVMTTEIHNVAGTDFASTFDHAVLPEALARWTELGLLTRASPMLEPADAARAIAFQLSQPDPVSIHDLVIRSRAN